MYSNFNNFQSIQGPTDPILKSSEIEGYQPVSRIGEVVINSFVDVYEFGRLKETIRRIDMLGLDFNHVFEQTAKLSMVNLLSGVDKEEQNKVYQEIVQVYYANRDKSVTDIVNALLASITDKKGGNRGVDRPIFADMFPDSMESVAESRPHFHEWATVLPGMICLSRKARTSTFRSYTAAETATPVIACASCMTMDDANNFFFAGIARSKSVRPIDDGNGPSFDEFFTMSIGGMATILNNCSETIFPGDLLEWTLFSEDGKKSANKRVKAYGPRRVGVQPASPTSERIIGRALSFAKPGETIDILIRAA
jgi:hypothetical protein